MKRFVLSFISIAFLFSQGISTATAAEKSKQTVISVVPILYTLSQELLKNTEVNAEYLPPKRLPISRISNWIKRKGEAAISSDTGYSVVLTIESIRPDLSVYPLVRTRNIRVIPIDAANELSPTGSKITLVNSDTANIAFFWLDMNNLITMSQIIARDLAAIWPEHENQIQKNQLNLQNQINTFIVDRDELLLSSDRFNLCLSDNKLMSMAISLNMPVTAADSSCDEASSIVLGNISKKEDSTQGKWAINTFNKPIKGNLEQWLQTNLSSLNTAIQ